jgi:hypothetical protein
MVDSIAPKAGRIAMAANTQERTKMYRLEVRPIGSPSKMYEFLEDTLADARHRAEEIGRDGFWVEDADPPYLIPPSQIELIQLFPTKKAKAG